MSRITASAFAESSAPTARPPATGGDPHYRAIAATLSFAARKLVGKTRRAIADAELFQCFHAGDARLLRADAVELQRQRDVLDRASPANKLKSWNT